MKKIVILNGAGKGISDVFLNDSHCSWLFNNPFLFVSMREPVFLVVLRFSSYDDMVVPKTVPIIE